jgi:outer membrane protein assembly factor BamB
MHKFSGRPLLGGDSSVSITASDDYLYTSGGYVWSDSERLIAFDLRTGKTKWGLATPKSGGALRVLDNVIYKWDGRSLLAFNAAGKQVWQRQDLWMLPTMIGDRLYVGMKQKPALAVIQPHTWIHVQEIPVPEVPQGSLVIDGDKAYYGTRGGLIVSLDLHEKRPKASKVASRILSPLVKHGPLLIFNAEVSGNFALIAYDLDNGVVKWSVSTQTLSQSTPLVEGSWVFFGADQLYRIELSTGIYQAFDMSGGPVGNPVMGAKYLYVPGGRFMHEVDPKTGRILERFAAKEWVGAPPTGGSPVIKDGVVYFGSLDGHVYGVRFYSRQ